MGLFDSKTPRCYVGLEGTCFFQSGSLEPNVIKERGEEDKKSYPPTLYLLLFIRKGRYNRIVIGDENVAAFYLFNFVG